MKLRWLITRNKVTAEMVAAYRSVHNCSMAEAKRRLVNEQGPVLQYQTLLGSWEDVPTVVEEVVEGEVFADGAVDDA